MPTVYNHDVAGICRRINRFLEELVKSVSSGVQLMNEFDQKRIMSYLQAIATYRDWITAQPQLDLPETHPRTIEIGPDAEVPVVENEATRDLLNLLQLARDELVNSQSARLPSGLVGFDEGRLTAIVNKANNFLVSYVQKTQPVDMPESSPSYIITGAGKTGI